MGYEDAAHTRQQILNDMEEDGEPLTQSRYDNRLEDKLQRQSEFARLVGSMGAFGLGLDMGVASTTAAIALENNLRRTQEDEHAKLSVQRDLAGVEEGDELDRAVGSLEEFMESQKSGQRTSYTIPSGMSSSDLLMSSSDLLWSSSGLTRGSQRQAPAHIQRRVALIEDTERAFMLEKNPFARAMLAQKLHMQNKELQHAMVTEPMGPLLEIRESVERHTDPRRESLGEEIRGIEEASRESLFLGPSLEDDLWAIRWAHSTVEHAPHMVPVTPLEVGEVGLTLLPMGEVAGIALKEGASLLRTGNQIGRSFMREAGSVSRSLLGEVRQSRMAQSIDRFFAGDSPKLEDVLRPIGRFQSDGTVIPFTPAELESLLSGMPGVSRSRMQTVPMFDTNKSVVQAMAEQVSTKPLMGEYRTVRGHHVHAKKAFEGHVNYDPKKGFSISSEYMRTLGIDHELVTTTQRKLFTELALSGKQNTLQEHTRIAVEALIIGSEGAITRQQARDIVARSLQHLRQSNVRAPTNIPWNS